MLMESQSNNEIKELKMSLYNCQTKLTSKAEEDKRNSDIIARLKKISEENEVHIQFQNDEIHALTGANEKLTAEICLNKEEQEKNSSATNEKISKLEVAN